MSEILSLDVPATASSHGEGLATSLVTPAGTAGAAPPLP